MASGKTVRGRPLGGSHPQHDDCVKWMTSHPDDPLHVVANRFNTSIASAKKWRREAGLCPPLGLVGSPIPAQPGVLYLMAAPVPVSWLADARTIANDRLAFLKDKAHIGSREEAVAVATLKTIVELYQRLPDLETVDRDLGKLDLSTPLGREKATKMLEKLPKQTLQAALGRMAEVGK